MAAMTLQQLRNNVRSHLDVDTEELPDELIDLYAQEGYDRVLRAQLRWPWMESGEIIPTASGQLSYALTVLADVSNITIDTVGQLTYLDPQDLLDRFYESQTSRGIPAYWSFFHSALYLWPVPDGIYSAVLYGYRRKLDWISDGAGGTPFGPDEIGPLVQTWIFSCAYMQVGDYELGQMYEQRFDKGVAELANRFMQAPPTAFVLNERPGATLPARLRYPWESV